MALKKVKLPNNTTVDINDSRVVSDAIVYQGDTVDSATYVSEGIVVDLSDYQRKLVSGENIKTINNQSLLGSGNISIESGGNVGTLNTTNSTAQTTSSSESLSGAVNLHKISKTGTYSDLIGKPTVDSSPTSSSTNLVTSGGVYTALTNGSVTKVGTSTVGSTSKPIYLNAGTPTQVTNVETSYLKEPARATITSTTLPLVTTTRTNKLILLPASQIIIEKTTDGGTTWVDAEVSDANKRNLFIGSLAGYNCAIPQINGVKNKLCGLRITITAMKYNVPEGTTETNKYQYWNSNYVTGVERYVNLTGVYIWDTAGSDRIRTRVYCATGNDPNTWVSTDSGANVYLDGNSGGNYLYLSGKVFGGGTNQTGNYWNYRFEFFTDGNNGGDLSTSQTTIPQYITRICGYGPSGWTLPNNLSKTDHLYTWDLDENAYFPASIYPSKNNASALGASSLRWGIIKAKDVDFSGTATISGNTTIGGTCSVAGVLTAPTAAAGTNTTQVATTAFVQNICGDIETLINAL